MVRFRPAEQQTLPVPGVIALVARIALKFKAIPVLKPTSPSLIYLNGIRIGRKPDQFLKSCLLDDIIDYANQAALH